MDGTDKLFDVLFPKHRGVFAPFNRGTARWISAYPGIDGYVILHVCAVADGLLSRAANWRNPNDYFSSPVMWRRLLTFQEGRDAIMAKQTRNKNWADNKAQWQGFLERRLTDDELDALDAWQPDAAEVWGCVDDLIQAGYRFTLSYNVRTKLATATLIDDTAERKTGGYALSAADEDGALALKALVFKHTTVLAGDWAALLSAPPKARRG